jgi:hypothetical protein
MTIHGSRALQWLRTFEFVEIGALVVAVVVAVATGLATVYYGNPVFGSFQDYLLLFLWGVGADQTKNAVQILGSS